jgi:hypothetical protein
VLVDDVDVVDVDVVDEPPARPGQSWPSPPQARSINPVTERTAISAARDFMAVPFARPEG